MCCFRSISQIWIILFGFRDTNDFVNLSICKHKLKFTCRGYSWFATFLTIFFHSVNKPNLRYLRKFQVDIPINARVVAVQSLEYPYTFILRQPCWWAKECSKPIFPYNMIENYPAFLAHNSIFIDLKQFKICHRDTLHKLIGHMKFWDKLIAIYVIMCLMASCANHELQI